MNSYLVTCVFDDDKSVDLIVPKDEINQVMRCIDKGESLAVFNKETHVGLWGNMEKMRCVSVRPYVAPEQKKEEPAKEEEKKEEFKEDKKK